MNEQSEQEIPILIEKILHERNMTPAEIAAAIGVSVPTLSRWQKPVWWQKKGRWIQCHAKGAFGKLRALGDGQGNTGYTVIGMQNVISINLQIDPLNLNEETLKRIRTVKKILLTLEELAEKSS